MDLFQKAFLFYRHLFKWISIFGDIFDTPDFAGAAFAIEQGAELVQAEFCRRIETIGRDVFLNGGHIGSPFHIVRNCFQIGRAQQNRAFSDLEFHQYAQLVIALYIANSLNDRDIAFVERVQYQRP